MSSVSSSSSAPAASVQPIDPRDLECSICLKTMDKVTTLVCGHSFGQPCIQRWLQDNSHTASCPMCKSRSFVLPSNEVLAKITSRRDALQAACDADLNNERCGGPDDAPQDAPLFVEEDPEEGEELVMGINCGRHFEARLRTVFATAVVAWVGVAAVVALTR